MRKFLFQPFVIFVCSLQTYAQNAPEYKIISNLKIKLKDLKGNEKVDCLCDLALEYISGGVIYSLRQNFQLLMVALLMREGVRKNYSSGNSCPIKPNVIHTVLLTNHT